MDIFFLSVSFGLVCGILIIKTNCFEIEHMYFMYFTYVLYNQVYKNTNQAMSHHNMYLKLL